MRMLSSTLLFALVVLIVVQQAHAQLKPAPKPAPKPVTTTNVVLVKSTILVNQPVPKPTQARVDGIPTLLSNLGVAYGKVKRPAPLRFSAAAASGKTTVINKSNIVKISGSKGTIKSATLKVQNDGALDLSSDAGLTVANSYTEFLAGTWLFNSRSQHSVQGGETVMNGARLMALSKGGFSATKASIKFTDTPISSQSSLWTLTDSSTTIAWTKPAPKVTDSRPMSVVDSIIRVNNGILRFNNVADLVFIRSTIAATNANIEFVNSVAYMATCDLNLKQVTLKFTNSRLVLTQLTTFSNDKFLRSSFGLPIKAPPRPPFPAFDSLKTAINSATGNFSLYSQNKW